MKNRTPQSSRSRASLTRCPEILPRPARVTRSRHLVLGDEQQQRVSLPSDLPIRGLDPRVTQNIDQRCEAVHPPRLRHVRGSQVEREVLPVDAFLRCDLLGARFSQADGAALAGGGWVQGAAWYLSTRHSAKTRTITPAYRMLRSAYRRMT